METLYKVQDMMFCELDDLSKKDKLDTKDVELIDKFVDIIKDINEITMSEDPMYSQMNNGSMGGSSYNNGSMHGSSYAGGMRGRYGRGMNRTYNRGGNGYSRDASKDMMLDHLSQVMDMAVDERDRKAVEKLMHQMQEN